MKPLHFATLLLLGFGLLVHVSAESVSRPIPAGYSLRYQQGSPGVAWNADFTFSDPKAWRESKEKDGAALELHGQSDYKPKHRSPFNIALLKDRVFDDFIMEVDVQSTIKPYPHQDLCFFFGFESTERFYYVHLAARRDPVKAESHAHDIFIVKDSPRLAIAKEVSDGVTWGDNTWHKVRIERQVASGSIRVFFDNNPAPIMHGSDTHFRSGYLGFGSFDDKGKFRNLRVWAPTMKTEKAAFFKQ